ncbi:hypothetical protein JM84_3055 [Dokdonia sp. Hel_I_63]|uniref:hypothetical protein n=1 Tax=Dokdonia sp. Hel_I_63 TaxID=1249996 RepID=UPI0011997EC6|nr:hypothetical protein [Dokdonia sp. Hel_I_63]TVZ24096.1 hypothetical protein JM84_3055 [Dokdonia sp. Hel_I_63]
MEIAKIILGQIKYLDRMALMAWGARNFVALPKSKEFQGGLRFKVNGLKHQGWVTIELTYLDEYTVTFINEDVEVVKVRHGVYCDMLVDIIDYIEGKEAA